MFHQKPNTVSLTSRGIKKIFEERKQDFLLQIVDSEQVSHTTSSSNKPKYKVIISDGAAQHIAVLGGNAALEYKNADEPKYCIICIKDLLIQEHGMQKIIIITELELIKVGLKKTMGTPIDYQEWLKTGSSKETKSAKDKDEKKDKNEESSQKVRDTKKSSGKSLENSEDKNEEEKKPRSSDKKDTPKGEKSVKDSRSLAFYSADPKKNKYMSLKRLKPEEPFLIKVRIAKKTELRKFKRTSKEGHIFTADLIDEDATEMNAIFFDEAAEYFFPRIHEDVVYVMSDGEVRMIPEKFRKNQGELQIVFESKDAVIQKVGDNPQKMKHNFNFVKINDINEKMLNTYVDLVAFVNTVGDLKKVYIKEKNENNEIRSISLTDDTSLAIDMTLWGDVAKSFNSQKGDVLVIKSARVSSFRGKIELSNSFNTIIITDREEIDSLSRVKELEKWQEKDRNKGRDSIPKQTSPNKQSPSAIKSQLAFTIKDILDANMTDYSKNFFDVRARIAHMKLANSQFTYPGCGVNTACSKKATFMKKEGLWKCNECDMTFKNPSYHYILTIKLEDGTGEIWVNAFDQIGEIIIGFDANKAQEMLTKNHDSAVAEILRNALKKEYDFKILSKPETFNGESRYHMQVMKVQPIN